MKPVKPYAFQTPPPQSINTSLVNISGFNARTLMTSSDVVLSDCSSRGTEDIMQLFSQAK